MLKFAKQKIVVFDMNFDYKEKIELNQKIIPFIKIASQYQIVLIVTTSSMKNALEYINFNTITSGYLVADSGAIIYDIAKQEYFFESKIVYNNAFGLIHDGLMSTFNVVLDLKSDHLINGADLLTTSYLATHSYTPLDVIKDYEALKQVLVDRNIYAVKYYSINRNLLKKANLLIAAIKQDYPVNVYENLENNFYSIVNDDCTKIGAIYKVMSQEKISETDNVLYIGITSIDFESINAFKNKIANAGFINQLSFNNKKIKILDENINKLDLMFGAKTNNFWQ